MKTTLLMLLLTLTGCFVPIAGDGYDGPTNPQPNQIEAIGIIMNSFGVNFAPPPIMWHFNDTCTDSNGVIHTGSYRIDGDCVLGSYQGSGLVETTTYEAPDRIDIEWNGKFSTNQTLAHELCHAWHQYFFNDDGDPNHTSNCFVGWNGLPFGNNGKATIGSFVYDANAALINAGL